MREAGRRELPGAGDRAIRPQARAVVAQRAEGWVGHRTVDGVPSLRKRQVPPEALQQVGHGITAK